MAGLLDFLPTKEGLLSGYNRVNGLLEDAVRYTDPKRFVSPSDAASMLPGGGLVTAWQESGKGRDALKAGDYAGAAGAYGNMLLNMVPEGASLGKMAMAVLPAAKSSKAITVWRGGNEKGGGGKTFYATAPEGAAPYSNASGSGVREVQISPENLFDVKASIDDWRLYNKFLEETGSPAGRGKNGHPFWTAEPELRAWLEKKGRKVDAIKFDENTGVPSIAVYDR